MKTKWCTWESSWKRWTFIQFGGGSATREDVRIIVGGLTLERTTPNKVGREESSNKAEERNHDSRAANVNTSKGASNKEGSDHEGGVVEVSGSQQD